MADAFSHLVSSLGYMKRRDENLARMLNGLTPMQLQRMHADLYAYAKNKASGSTYDTTAHRVGMEGGE